MFSNLFLLWEGLISLSVLIDGFCVYVILWVQSYDLSELQFHLSRQHVIDISKGIRDGLFLANVTGHSGKTWIRVVLNNIRQDGRGATTVFVVTGQNKLIAQMVRL